MIKNILILLSTVALIGCIVAVSKDDMHNANILAFVSIGIFIGLFFIKE